MYIKQYISAIKYLTSEFSDQEKKEIRWENKKTLLNEKKEKKIENSMYIVWVFTITLEKMFADTEENGKDLLRLRSS